MQNVRHTFSFFPMVKPTLHAITCAISYLRRCEPSPCFGTTSDALTLLLTLIHYMTGTCYLASFVTVCHIEDKQAFP